MIYAEIYAPKKVATIECQQTSLDAAADALYGQLTSSQFLRTPIKARELHIINVAQIESVRVYSDREDGT